MTVERLRAPKKINTKIFLPLFSAFLFSFAGSFSQLQGFSNKNQSTLSQEIIIKTQEMLFIDYGNNFSNTLVMVIGNANQCFPSHDTKFLLSCTQLTESVATLRGRDSGK